MLQKALNRQRRGGHGLVQHADHPSQASSSETRVGSPPKSSRKVEPEEEQDEGQGEGEDRCSEEWRWKFEEEQRKVHQLEQELVRKTDECKARAAAFSSLEEQIREQVQELGHLLVQEPGAPGKSRPWSPA